MSDVDGSFSKRTLQFYKITTHLVLTCMIISTICGIIIVSDFGNSSKGDMAYSFKSMGIPAWTSLPLTLSITLGYLFVFLKNEKIIFGKLIADILNILFMILFIIFASAYMIKGLQTCVRKSDDFRFEYSVDCTMNTLSRFRLEFGLYIVIMIMESIAMITLFVSVVFYCTHWINTGQ